MTPSNTVRFLLYLICIFSRNFFCTGTRKLSYKGFSILSFRILRVFQLFLDLMKHSFYQDDINIKNGQVGVPPPPPIRTVSQTQINPAGRLPSRAPPPPPPAHKRPSQPPPPPPSQPLPPPPSQPLAPPPSQPIAPPSSQPLAPPAPTKALPPPPPPQFHVSFYFKSF
jgi:hypothetical protein